MNFRDINHAQMYLNTINQSLMRTIDCQKVSLTFNYPQIPSKCHNTTSTIATHRAFEPIGIVLNHLKIVAFPTLQEHQPLPSYSDAPITHCIDQLLAQTSVFACSIIA